MSADQELEDLVESLNEEDPVDIDQLAEAFDQVFYEDPEGSGPVESEHVRGLTVSSPGSVGELVDKLERAKDVRPDFVRIGDQEYEFDSASSLSRLIDGIRLGSGS